MKVHGGLPLKMRSQKNGEKHHFFLANPWDFQGVILVFKGEYDVWSVFFWLRKKNVCFGFSSQKAKGTCAQLAVEKIDQKHDNKNHWNHVNLLQVCVVFFVALV